MDHVREVVEAAFTFAGDILVGSQDNDSREKELSQFFSSWTA
jgi:hypothetical protein